MSNSNTRPTFEWGDVVDAGKYECASCGHVVDLAAKEELPTCPADDGHHSIKAWHPVDSLDDCDATLPNSPAK